jgi:hypothetical protein
MWRHAFCINCQASTYTQRQGDPLCDRCEEIEQLRLENEIFTRVTKCYIVGPDGESMFDVIMREIEKRTG